MKCTTGTAKKRKAFAIVAVLICWLSTWATEARAQQGQDAVYNSTGGIAASPSFIDASMFLNPTSQGRDVCDTIFYILTHNYPSSGAVIDARGIRGATNLTCTHGSPWTEGTTTVTAPSTILAGGPGF